jgi:4-hydroxy-tetrahydrodipicolinate reductase
MNILIIGYGKMGKAIAALAEERGHRIAAILDVDNKTTFQLPAQIDVAIEFTNPEAAIENIRFCFQHGLPVVCGSTGWYAQAENLKSECLKAEGALLYASNFSVGVNLVFKVNEYLARLMSTRPEYQVDIDETHHTQKKDAPSGTAISLAEGILRENPRKKRWINQPAAQPDALEIRSHRVEDVPGTHVVTYTSAIDTIQLSHEAHTRTGFALGAVLAAEFLQGKRGVYTMADVLQF